jgi:microcystin-dependent protein
MSMHRLEDLSMSSDIPVGTVCPFAGQVKPVTGSANTTWSGTPCGSSNPVPGQTADAPVSSLEAQGWMLCDGRKLSTQFYPELFSILGHLYGPPNGGEQFQIPDYRGLFLRGFDAGAGMDPQAAFRQAANASGTANTVGSFQCDAFQTHSHDYNIVSLSGISQQGNAAGTSSTSTPTTAPNPPAATGPETRPKNIAVNYIIKYR